MKFYVTDHSADENETGNPEKLKQLYGELAKNGITSVRYDWRWNKIEPIKEDSQEDHLERYGRAVEIMKESGLEPPTIVLSSIPTWALELYKKDKEDFFVAYYNYVEKVKNELVTTKEKTGQTISRVQILNELNMKIYTPIEGDDLPRLCEITREVFRNYNPEIQLMTTVFAGNLPRAIEKLSLGKINLGSKVEDYLEEHEEILRNNFDIIAVDYYPGMWHIPLGEARENQQEIFKQLGLLEKTMEKIASWGKEYELGEVGIQTNMPLLSKKHNQDRQRYFYDVFFRSFKQLLLDFQKRGIPLPSRVGIYEAIDEAPKNLTGKILSKTTPFPENNLGILGKETTKGNRHISKNKDRDPSQLSKIIEYMNKPVKKD